MNYHWDWLFLLERADDGRIFARWLLDAWLTTVLVAVLAFSLALVLGTIVGTLRVLDNRFARLIGATYTELFRNIPLLVQLFIWFMVLPELVPNGIGMWMKLDMPATVTGVISLGLYTSARIAEQVRSGLGSIGRGQSAAATALGLSMPQTFRHVLYPSTFQRIMPTLTNEALNAFKNSSVTFAVGVAELTFVYRQVIEKTSQVFEVTILNLAIYLASAVVIFVLATSLDRRLSRFINIQPGEAHGL